MFHHFFSFFLYMANMRAVTAKPPKILTEASTTAPNPNHFDTPPAAPSPEAAAAINAPTTMTEEMAFVTAIKGVCSAGVTDHTT